MDGDVQGGRDRSRDDGPCAILGEGVLVQLVPHEGV